MLKLPQSSWVKPGEKPIKLTPAMRTELSRAIGEKNVRVLETDIGFAPRREREPPQVDPMFRYETAWQQAPRPVFKQATEVKANDAGFAVDEAQTYAEYWMGTHPNAP